MTVAELERPTLPLAPFAARVAAEGNSTVITLGGETDVLLSRSGSHRRKETPMSIGIGTLVLIVLVVLLFMVFSGRRA